METLLEEKTKSEWNELLTGEFLLFGLLGKIFYGNPDREWLEPLVTDDVFAGVPFAATRPRVRQGLSLLQQWSQDFQSRGQDEVINDLKADYTRLFMVTEKLPVTPWESVYYSEERLLFQESTVDVRRWYQRFGLEAVNVRKEPDDHIALELAFMAHLARLGLQALSDEDETAFQETLEAQRGFCKKHLLLWAPRWCEQMIEYSHTDFYRGLALVLRGALDELAEMLNVSVPQVRHQ